MKKKRVAGVLALLTGMWGVHRFYLGQRLRGFLMFALFGIMMIATVEEDAPFIILPALIGFIDAILFFVMPKEEFDHKYNRKSYQYQQLQEKQAVKQNSRRSKRGRRRSAPSPNAFKTSGIAKYQEYDYVGAIHDFKKSLEIRYEDPAVHFNLACCYSIMEETENAFFHLDKAVSFGFEDFDKIHAHDALAFLRTSTDFDPFVQNNYRKIAQLSSPKEDMLDTTTAVPNLLMDGDILEKIASLGELRDKGFLTEEEFALQKKRLLEMR